MFKQIVFLVLAASCVSASISWGTCGGLGDVSFLTVQGCQWIPCIFSRGFTYLIEMNLFARNPIHSLLLNVTAHPPNVQPITTMIANACTMMDAPGCPITYYDGNMRILRIRYTVPVGSVLPLTILPLQFSMVDNLGNHAFCFRINVDIRN